MLGEQVFCSKIPRELLNMQDPLLNRGDKILVFMLRNLRVDFVNDLETLCYLWRQTSPTMCYRGRLHLRCLSQTFPSLDLYL